MNEIKPDGEISITVKSAYRLTESGFDIKDSELIISYPESDYLMSPDHPIDIRMAFGYFVSTVLAGGVNAAIRSLENHPNYEKIKTDIVKHVSMNLEKMLSLTDGEFVDLYNEDES